MSGTCGKQWAVGFGPGSGVPRRPGRGRAAPTPGAPCRPGEGWPGTQQTRRRVFCRSRRSRRAAVSGAESRVLIPCPGWKRTRDEGALESAASSHAVPTPSWGPWPNPRRSRQRAHCGPPVPGVPGSDFGAEPPFPAHSAEMGGGGARGPGDGHMGLGPLLHPHTWPASHRPRWRGPSLT